MPDTLVNQNKSETPAEYPILLDAPVEDDKTPCACDPEEIENGCQWCDAEQCLHHHTFELPEKQ